jgi:RES domain-containing protein
LNHVERSGRHFRVCDPTWEDPLDTTFSSRAGGRWNAPGSYGVLYLNATIMVAAANARHNYEGEIATLFDLRPNERPDIQLVNVHHAAFVDAVTPAGIRALRLPKGFPFGVPWPPCQRIGARAYAARESGIATRSNADATATSFVGEELAIFDTAIRLVSRQERLSFDQWYPVEVPTHEPRM